LKDDFGALIICSGTRNLFGFGNNTGKETEVMGMRNILTAIGDRSPKIAFVSTILVTRRRSHPLGWLLNTIRGGVLEQKLEAEELLRSTSLPYLILRPGGLTNATAGKAYLHFDQDDRVMGMVARADVANVLVEWVDSHLKSRVTCELIGKPRKLYDTNWPEQFNDLISY
jgi:uncharacterized protein YbjT (DUF2867 family)